MLPVLGWRRGSRYSVGPQRLATSPHMDQQLEKQVLDKSWLSEVKAPDLSRDRP